MSELCGNCLNCNENVIREESVYCDSCEGFYHTKCVKFDNIQGESAEIFCLGCGSSLGFGTNFETDDELQRLT